MTFLVTVTIPCTIITILFYFFLVFKMIFFSESKKIKIKRKTFFATFHNILLVLLDFINQIVSRSVYCLVLFLLYKLCPALSILMFSVKY